MLLLLCFSAGLVWVACGLWLVFGWAGEAPQDGAMRKAIDTTVQALETPVQGTKRRRT